MWILATLASGLSARLAERGGVRALGGLGASYWGMWVAHLGMAMCIAGVGLTTVYSDERDVRMAPGDEVQLAVNSSSLEGSPRRSQARFAARTSLRVRESPISDSSTGVDGLPSSKIARCTSTPGCLPAAYPSFASQAMILRTTGLPAAVA